jgi:hypothetical protein
MIIFGLGWVGECGVGGFLKFGMHNMGEGKITYSHSADYNSQFFIFRHILNGF